MTSLFHPESLLRYLSKGLLLTMLLSVSGPAFAAAVDEIRHFPEAGPGMKKVVIVLPVKPQHERDFKVELIAGKWMHVDGVNRYHLQATIAAQPLKGWGYTYYKVTANDAAMSTMMAAPDHAKGKQAFVQGDSILIPYNSRLPVVCYLPVGYQLHYRIWSAGPQHNAEEISLPSKTAAAPMDALTGAWIEPVPGMANQHQGFVLHADGRAESINMQTLQYQSWSADANHLTLTATSIGNHNRSTHRLRYEYKLLADGRLMLKQRNTTSIYHRR